MFIIKYQNLSKRWNKTIEILAIDYRKVKCYCNYESVGRKNQINHAKEFKEYIITGGTLQMHGSKKR